MTRSAAESKYTLMFVGTARLRYIHSNALQLNNKRESRAANSRSFLFVYKFESAEQKSKDQRVFENQLVVFFWVFEIGEEHFNQFF